MPHPLWFNISMLLQSNPTDGRSESRETAAKHHELPAQAGEIKNDDATCESEVQQLPAHIQTVCQNHPASRQSVNTTSTGYMSPAFDTNDEQLDTNQV